MRKVCAAVLGGLFALGCGGVGGLAAGNRRPGLNDLSVSPDKPNTGGSVEFTPEIDDEDPGSCTVLWTLKRWNGAFQDGEPVLEVAPGGQATTSGENRVTYSVGRSGWYSVEIEIRDDIGLTYSTTWDFTDWCQNHPPFDQVPCQLLPVGDPSDGTAPTIDVASVVLRGMVTDTAGSTDDNKKVTALDIAPRPPHSITLDTPGSESSTFAATIDCTGASPTTATLISTDADGNTSNEEITVTETVVP